MITVEGLTKLYTGPAGTVRALDNVTFDVGDATICGVLGGEDSGKSTLARLVAAREVPDAGTVLSGDPELAVAGVEGGGQSSAGVGLLDAGVTDELSRQRTVAGNVGLALERRGLSASKRRSRVAELLDLTGLTEQAGVGIAALDIGRRRRVALATVLAGGSSLVVVDEPTAGLDAAASAGMLTVLDRAAGELGLSVLLLTRDVGVVRKACDDIALLVDGRLVEHGNLLRLASTPGSTTARRVLPDTGESARSAASAHDRVAEVSLVGFAAVGALLPEASSRFDVDIAVLGGGLVRFGDTPMARFALGVTGECADVALAWIADQGAVVATTGVEPEAVERRTVVGSTRAATRGPQSVPACRAA